METNTVRLVNSGFEGRPMRGEETNWNIKGWTDCGKINFPKETPPDIHAKGFWQIEN